jgi:hypothetical protein
VIWHWNDSGAAEARISVSCPKVKRPIALEAPDIAHGDLAGSEHRPEWRQFRLPARRTARAAGHGCGFLNRMIFLQTRL